jgi:hypothetical protein
MPGHPSNSSEHERAGSVLVDSLSRELGVPLKNETLKLREGCSVQIDGYSMDPPVLCEAWGHMGRPKGSQPDKIMSDALKMLFCEKSLGRSFRKVLVFADKAAESLFVGNSWQAACLKDQHFELRVFELPGALAKEVGEAQKRQRMINPTGRFDGRVDTSPP